MNKVVYLGIFMLELDKTLFYEFLYYYEKPKYGEKAIFCYMDTVSLCT